MEENGADVVQVSIQGEEASSRLVRPDLDLVIITPRHEQGLCFVEVYAPYRAIMFLKAIDKSAHAVVPQLNCRGMKRDEDPWSATQIESTHALEPCRGRSLTFLDEMRCLWHGRIWTRTAVSLADAAGRIRSFSTFVSIFGEEEDDMMG